LTPYPISGTCYDTNGSTVLANVSIKARNETTNELYPTSIITDSNGRYSINAGNFTAKGYNNGDIITIWVIYTNYEDYVEHIIDTSVGYKQNLNLTLEIVPGSPNLKYITVGEFYDFFNLSSTSTADNFLSTNTVVNMGVNVEKEIDSKLNTIFGFTLNELDRCDATTGWSASTDASAIAVTSTADEFKSRPSALDLGKSGATEALSWYRKTLSTQYDFNDNIIMVWLYLTNTTGLATSGTSVRLKFGSDSSNYYYKDFYLADVATGWNLLYFDIDIALTTGNPVSTQCDTLEIYFTTTAATTTVTAGNWIMDSWRLVHDRFFNDEYIDAKKLQEDFFLEHKPVKELVYFAINTSEEDSTPSWTELTVDDDEIELDKETGRIRINDSDNYPEEGSQQTRAIYLVGNPSVPQDIKKLAMLMLARDIIQSTVGRALLKGNNEFTPSSFTVFDTQIDSIMANYRRFQMTNV